MMGTSAGMEIEENLALAERRGRHHTLRPGIRRGEREDYRRRLRELGLGLDDRLTTKVGTLSGGQRQALTLLMATLQKPSCCCWTSTPLPWIPRRPSGSWISPTAWSGRTT